MNVLEISLEHSQPVNMIAFEVDLNANPPEIRQRTLEVRKYLPVNQRVKTMQFREASFSEGVLNIYTVLFESGRCIIYFFGNLQGTELNTETVLENSNQRNFDLLNERIKFILNKSRHILKSYYKDAKIKNIEHHVLAFLSDT